jgi:hypothetical protein
MWFRFAISCFVFTFSKLCGVHFLQSDGFVCQVDLRLAQSVSVAAPKRDAAPGDAHLEVTVSVVARCAVFHV